MTFGCLAASVVVFVGVSLSADSGFSADFGSWGWVPSDLIWRGQVEGLVTSAFVHLELWHLAFDMYWLNRLGGVLERELGPLRVAGFILFSAWVSSAAQLAVSGDTGIGFSGVGYALFGFIWAVRRWHPAYQSVLSSRDALWFLVWLVGCLVATWANIWDVGNSAHLAGLAFGGLLGAASPGSRWRRPAAVGVAALFTAFSASLVYAPWSGRWTASRAVDAAKRGDLGAAIDGFRRSISLGVDPEWGLSNLAIACLDHGDLEGARTALADLKVIDSAAAITLGDYFAASGEAYLDGAWGRRQDPAGGIAVLDAACATGNGDACQRLGFALVRARDESRDDARGAAAFARSCDLGSPIGCQALATVLWRGVGLPRDRERASKLSTRLCSEGVADACDSLGVAFAVGEGVAKDDRRALAYYEQACALDPNAGCANAGWRYLQGRGAAKDEVKGLALLERACAAGGAYGCLSLGQALKEQPEKHGARIAEVFLKACDGSEGLACKSLGDVYRLGTGVPANAERSEEFYRRAAPLFAAECDRHDGRDCSGLARLYEEGRGVERDEAKAEELRRAACAYDSRECPEEDQSPKQRAP